MSSTSFQRERSINIATNWQENSVFSRADIKKNHTRSNLYMNTKFYEESRIPGPVVSVRNAKAPSRIAPDLNT